MNKNKKEKMHKNEKVRLGKRNLLKFLFVFSWVFIVALAVLAASITANNIVIDKGNLNLYDILFVNNNGNVGIGTANPGTTKLRVVSASDEIFKADDGANAVIRAKANGTVTFEKGNVGIGTANPTEKLDVAGNIKSSGTICDANGCIGSNTGASFGGMYQKRDSGPCATPNPITGSCTCPAGYTPGKFARVVWTISPQENTDLTFCYQ